MIKSILSLLGSTLEIWQHENAKKYLEEKNKLERQYDEENDKTKPDHNILGHIERSIMRLSDLVSFEIGKSKASN